ISNSSALSFINLLKLRASYGEVGNDQVGNERFLWFTSWANAGDDGRYWFGTGNNPPAAAGWSQGAIGNPGVTWERGRKLNVAWKVLCGRMH
ncbi:MAG TPA: hypothetical protein PKE30_16085, partial [Niabella sp.]|nr:hypothetical protein [Niabella sp.]